jgi:prepilin signal peptidase PulO-like enzyme (type II secretory pathway)
MLIASGKAQRGSALPFGVFLSLAGVVTLFVGQDMWYFYLRLIGGV